VFGGEDVNDGGQDVLGNPGSPLHKNKAAKRGIPQTEGNAQGKAQGRIGYRNHPVLGLLWESAAAYRRLHAPSVFLTNKTLLEATGRTRLTCPLLAVVNARTGEVLVDRAPDHSQMISDAAWEYGDAIRLLPVTEDGRTELITLHDGLPPALVSALTRRLPRVLVQALVNG
jgi:hypothetical protein